MENTEILKNIEEALGLYVDYMDKYMSSWSDSESLIAQETLGKLTFLSIAYKNNAAQMLANSTMTKQAIEYAQHIKQSLASVV